MATEQENGQLTDELISRPYLLQILHPKPLLCVFEIGVKFLCI